LFSTVSFAQVDGLGVQAETTCDGNQVNIHITFLVGEALPDNIVSWVVEREVIGVCVDVVDVGDIRTLPREPGSHEFTVLDNPVELGKAIYYIKAVDEDGNRLWVNWGNRTMFTQADCLSGIAARGLVMENAGYLYLEVCEDECWWELSYWDNIFPADQELPPVGATIAIYGEILWGMHGPYINASFWVESPICQSVGAEGLNWGGLKSIYR